MTLENQYDIQELEQRYEDLDEALETGLNSYWADIITFLEETDRDWVKKEHIKEARGIDNVRFSQGYDGFLEVFKPEIGTGGAFAFYEMDYEAVKDAGEKIGLPEVETDEEEGYRWDEFLEGDYEDP